MLSGALSIHHSSHINCRLIIENVHFSRLERWFAVKRLDLQKIPGNHRLFINRLIQHTVNCERGGNI